MRKYRILWEKSQMGNSIVKANSEEEAKKIALENIKDAKYTKAKIVLVGAYTIEYIKHTIA